MTAARMAVVPAALALIALALSASAAGEYYNISNAPFATISNGPQNAIIVDVLDPNNPAEVEAAIGSVLGRTTRAAGSPIVHQIARLREAGLIRPEVDPEIYATVLVRSGGAIEPITRATRAYGGGSITFTYSGWSAADESLLKSFVSIAYPIVQQVYGSPANTITVQVVNDTSQTEKDSLLGGVYVTGSGVQPQMRLWRFASNISLERSFLHLMIHAFHDTAAFDYDAWEEGFTRAAAVAAGEEIDKKIVQQFPAGPLEPMDFVGRDIGGDAFYYLMSTYETLNQPALSNNTFFTSWVDTLQGGGNFGGMIIPRLGMSSSAWLKVYIERLRTDGQSFFSLFNQQYYQQLSSNSGIAGNVPVLKGIAAGITPTVENIAFDSWFGRQYVFDTSVSLGKKLYAFTFPPDVPANPGTEGYSIPTFLIYYTTTSTGDETPLSGTVYPVYWDYRYATDLFLSGQYEMVPIENGEGYVTPTFFVDNIGGTQRVAMDFTIGTETARVYFPAGMAGTVASSNNFLGVVTGAESGSINAKVDAEATGTTATVTRGAFGASLPSLIGFSRLRITYTPTTGSQVVKTVNVGPGGYQAIINSPAAASTLFHTFTAGLRMMSVPMTTFEQDQSRALQDGSGSPAIPADKLLLARWNPLLADAYKYEMYPRTPPFTPGRAYWLKLSSSTNVTVIGESPDPGSDWRVGLVNGWNQVGTPFATSVAVSTLLIEKGNDEPITFAEAWSRGLVGKIIWKYTPGSGYSEAATLEPWEGYWFKCNVPDGVVLTIPGPESRTRSASRAASVGGSGGTLNSKNDWSMKVSAHTSGGDSSTVTLGLAVGATDGFDYAFDADSPPSYGRATTLASVVPGRVGEPCAVDTRTAGAEKITWEMIVTPQDANEDVVLKWQDISDVPKRYRLTLVDESTGRSQFIRTTSSYRFNSGDGSQRRLKLIADSSPSTRLLISNVTVGPTRGTSVSFSYGLSSGAQVTAEIVGPTGRRVRRIEDGRVTRSGINSMTWDRRDDAGRSVPAGVYMLQMTATTEDGEMVKTVRPVLLAR